MLQGITWASPPALTMPSATTSQASALRLEITTLAPSLASSSADERPMPRLEPVTTATLPVRSNGVFFIFLPPCYFWSRHCEKRKRRSDPFCLVARWIASLRSQGRWMDLHQPAGVGDAAEVVVGVAKGVFDHGQPLEVVADLGFLGHADAAMKLDRLLADELQGFSDLHLGGGDRGGALLGAVEIGRHGREH